MRTISRKDAKYLNLTRYYTGQPCKRGHIAQRLVSNYVCVECDKERNKKYTDNRKEYLKHYYKDNIIQILNYRKVYYYKNKDKIKQYQKLWREENPDRCALKSIEYLNRKSLARPAWYEKDLIKQLYHKRDELSELWGIELHVDHIVPLQGENVCGLHCWDNLQLLEASINLSKGNR